MQRFSPANISASICSARSHSETCRHVCARVTSVSLTAHSRPMAEYTCRHHGHPTLEMSSGVQLRAATLPALYAACIPVRALLR